MFKYHYIVFFNNADFYQIPYHDMAFYPGVEAYFGFQPDNPLLAKLFHAHTSKKVNSFVNIPGKSLWMKRFINFDTPDDKPLCFVFMASYLAYEYVRSFVRRLHSEYPQARFVCFYSDIIKDDAIIPNNLSPLFDIFISYDEGDAKKYGIKYHPTSFSDISVEINNTIDQCDVYFLAAPKDRLTKIYNIYDQLCDSGLSCNFFLIGVPKKKQRSGITFLTSRMPYSTNLQYVIKSKCLLEVEQRGAVGATLRTWEAINYGNGLITDNYNLAQTDFYNSRFVSFISKNNIVDVRFVKDYEKSVNPLRDTIRPIHLFRFIDSSL